MASLYEQMDNLLTPDSFKEGLAKSAEENKDMNLSDTFSFDRFKKEALPQFREKDEIIEKATATGTGLLTGTLGLPSDIISMASAGADLVGDYTNNPTFTVVKDLLNRAEKESGRPAFDKWFTETTGLESNPANTDQLIGEILSPTGAFLVPLKTLNKLFKPLKKGASEFFDNFTDGTGGAKLATQSATSNNVGKAPQIDDFNQATISLNEVGKNSATGKVGIENYEKLEETAIKNLKIGTKYTDEAYKKLPSATKDLLYLRTGAYRDQEGFIKYKIPTADAQLNQGLLSDPRYNVLENGNFNAENIPTEGLTIEQVLNYKDLYKEYPTLIENAKRRTANTKQIQYGILKDIKIKNFDTYIKERGFDEKQIQNFRDGGTRAIYSRSGTEETIYLSSGKMNGVKSDLLHEIQHAIQRREGHPVGASPDDFLRNDKTKIGQDYLALEDNIIKEKDVLLNSLSSGKMTLMNKNAAPNPIYKQLDTDEKKELFSSATDKLMLTQFNKIFDGSSGTKEFYKTLTPDMKEYPMFAKEEAGNFMIDFTKNYDSYNINTVKFSPEEANVINSMVGNPDFLYYLGERAIVERMIRNKKIMEQRAHIKYENVIGEKQARRVQDNQDRYNLAVEKARKEGKLGINEDFDLETTQDIFRQMPPRGMYLGDVDKNVLDINI